MAVMWRWDNKMGEVTLTQHNSKGELRKYKIEIFAANCLMALIYRYEDVDGTSMYQCHAFYSELDHLKNCLGLNPKKGYSTNLLGDYEDWRLNTYFKDSIKIAAELIKTHATVTLYYEDIAKKSKDQK